ncbi:aminotransferase class III-fold pyridoxal phosphate-dependent enzyme [Pseudohalocynthiibacter aestuariivivens]|nr:aminotransferase class III-fold pyridoxal phosphate-dependent enzyme [Pseudohalocynthiibacter aestuariivivens]
MTSGYVPLGATLISDEIYEVISRPQFEGGVFSMALTYFGHPVSCAAALKNIEIMENENLLANASTVGDYFQKEALSMLQNPVVGDVRGKWLMLAVDIVADKSTKEAFPVSVSAGQSVFNKCLEKGVIVQPVGDQIILSPPIILDNSHCDTMISALSEALDEFASEQG